MLKLRRIVPQVPSSHSLQQHNGARLVKAYREWNVMIWRWRAEIEAQNNLAGMCDRPKQRLQWMTSCCVAERVDPESPPPPVSAYCTFPVLLSERNFVISQWKSEHISLVNRIHTHRNWIDPQVGNWVAAAKNRAKVKRNIFSNIWEKVKDRTKICWSERGSFAHFEFWLEGR